MTTLIYVFVERNLGRREGILFVTSIKKNRENVSIDDLLVQEDECVLQEVYGGCLRRKVGKFFKNKEGKLLFHSVDGSFFVEIHKKEIEVLDSCLS